VLRRLPFAVAAIAVALLAAACSSQNVSPTQPVLGGASPGASGTACQTAPDPGNLPAWQPPATTPPIVPFIIANVGELTCGQNRFLFSFLDPQNNVLAKPDMKASVAIYDLARDPTKPISTVDGTFVWAIQDVRGEYISNVTFPEAGVYGFEFTVTPANGAASQIRATFSVDPSSPTVHVGQQAPAIKTPTAADPAGIAQISTDPSPDPAFYRVSEDQALAKHDPFVLIFATPKFCTSAQCGPTLDRLKPYAAQYPTVDFIHVEPYELQFANGQLQAVLDENGQLISNQYTNAWGLTGEPWVFVVDRTGKVTASFEVIFSDAEMTAALDAVK